MILIVSHDADDHAQAVLRRIREAQHPVTQVDTAEYPGLVTHALRYGDGRRGELVNRGQTVDLDRVGAVWWRRPQPYVLDPGLDAGTVTFALTECHEAMSGMWHALDAAWVNPPASDEVAHHKPLQLARAEEIGLSVPRTLITNDPAAAAAFADELGLDRTVYKTFMATEENWRETRLLRADELELLEAVRLAPVIFQEYVDAAADVRVTVVGDELLAAEIAVAPSSYRVDYRMDMAAASFTPAELPDEISDKLLALMKRLDIVYGAIDLRRTGSGEYVFLEVNPAGEWLFVEERTALPITAAVADLLMRLDTEERL